MEWQNYSSSQIAHTSGIESQINDANLGRVYVPSGPCQFTLISVNQGPNFWSFIRSCFSHSVILYHSSYTINKLSAQRHGHHSSKPQAMASVHDKQPAALLTHHCLSSIHHQTSHPIKNSMHCFIRKQSIFPCRQNQTPCPSPRGQNQT